MYENCRIIAYFCMRISLPQAVIAVKKSLFAGKIACLEIRRAGWWDFANQDKLRWMKTT